MKCTSSEFKISKIDAARRQIDAAIRMLFSEEDKLAIHTLSMAGFRILRDIAAKKSTDLHKRIKACMAVGEGEFWGTLNKHANFLKHANNDADELLYDLNEKVNDIILLLSCFYYADLGHEPSPEMYTLTTFGLSLYPDFISGDNPLKYLFLVNKIDLSEMPRCQQLTMGHQMLQTAKANVISANHF